VLPRPGGWLSRCCAYQGSFPKSSKSVVNSVAHIRESACFSRLCRDNQGCWHNIDSISLKIGLQFLYASMGKDVYGDILELMPYIQGDVATTIAVTRLIVEYLETTDTVMLPAKVEAIVLQNVLQWIHSEYLDIRWNATRILLMLSQNSENYGVINHQLVTLIDSNGVYIKNLIMRHLHKTSGIADKTKEYIVSKCKHDTNFVVRMVCAEEEQKCINEE